MWAYKRLKRVEKKTSDLNKILHAGTYKIFGSRLWTYENSNEYVYGLKQGYGTGYDSDGTILFQGQWEYDTPVE